MTSRSKSGPRMRAACRVNQNRVLTPTLKFAARTMAISRAAVSIRPRSSALYPVVPITNGLRCSRQAASSPGRAAGLLKSTTTSLSSTAADGCSARPAQTVTWNPLRFARDAGEDRLAHPATGTAQHDGKRRGRGQLVHALTRSRLTSVRRSCCKVDSLISQRGRRTSGNSQS